MRRLAWRRTGPWPSRTAIFAAAALATAFAPVPDAGAHARATNAHAPADGETQPDASDALADATGPEAEAAVEAVTRGAKAEAEEDWPGAIEAYRAAMDLGVEDVDDTPIREYIARLHFAYGTVRFEAADYEQALRHFQDAQGLFPAPAFHYNIGKCQEELGKYEAAISSYEAYVRGVPDAPPTVVARIERLKETLASGADPGASGPVPDGGDDGAKGSPGRGLVITGGTLLGVGAVTGAVGVAVFGMRARDRSDQVQAIFDGNPDGASYGAALALDEEGRAAELQQIIFGAAGGAVAVTGAVLLAIGLKKQRSASAPTAAWQLTPSLHAGRAGFNLSGRF